MGLQQTVDAAIDAALVNRIVGCVVLVNQNGKEIYARTAGLADREANRKLERNAILRLASVTKPIVATAALRMMEAGLLQLDDPVTQVPALFHPAEPGWRGSPDHHAAPARRTRSGLSYETVPDRCVARHVRAVHLARGEPPPPRQGAAGVRARHRLDLWHQHRRAGRRDRGDQRLDAGSGGRPSTSAGPLGMVDWRFTPTDATRVTANYANGNPPIAPDRAARPHHRREPAGHELPRRSHLPRRRSAVGRRRLVRHGRRRDEDARSL